MGIARVGLIGAGRMGSGIGANLCKQGFELGLIAHVHRARIDSLLSEHGAREFSSPVELVRWADVVVLCVPSSREVEAICRDERGLLGADDPAVRAVVDCSTSHPESTLALRAEFADKRIEFYDAPLTRTPKEAAEGRLNSILGGGEAAYAHIGAVLDAFCENVLRVAHVGDGHRIKLINNALTMGMTALAAETLAASERAGISLQDVDKVVSLGGANSAPFQGLIAAHVRGEDALGFSLSNAAKDLAYYADSVVGDSRAPMADDVLRVLRAAAEACGGDSTLPKLIDYYLDNGAAGPR